jgi:hypothetical protein
VTGTGTTPPVAGSSVRHVQTTSTSASGGTSVIASINPTQAGDLLIVGISSTNGVSTASVTDNKGNVYSSAVQLSATNGSGLRIFYARNVAAGVTSVTANVPWGSADMIVAEYGGLDPIAPLDTAHAFDNGWLGGTTFTSGQIVVTAQANELLWGFATEFQSDVPIWTPGADWTARSTASRIGSFAEDRLVTSTGAYAATGLMSGVGSSYQIGAAIVTFR